MTFRVVVIGTGFGKYAAAPAFERQGCEVTLVSARDEVAIRAALQTPCDLLSIHSPPFMHKAHVALAVEHGCPVLCDKPFGRNAQEAQEMLEMVETAGLRHFLNFEFRFDAQRQMLKTLLDAGEIGVPQHLSYTAYLSRGAAMPHGWLFEQEQGGGWIGAFASHFVDSLHWMFGDIAEMSCLSRQDVKARPQVRGSEQKVDATAEDALVAWFRTVSGVTAMLDTSFSASADLPPQITLLGSEGVIQMLPGAKLQLVKRGAEPTLVVCGGGDNPMAAAMDVWVSKVLASLASGEPLQPDFVTGLTCARVLDQLKSQARTF